jgi:hypothetical protein
MNGRYCEPGDLKVGDKIMAYGHVKLKVIELGAIKVKTVDRMLTNTDKAKEKLKYQTVIASTDKSISGNPKSFTGPEKYKFTISSPQMGDMIEKA